MTLVKICGITNLEDARHAVECGADMLGFNFYSKSPRYISPESARSIIDDVRDKVQTVGVFVNEEIYQIYEATLASKIKTIQLHGDESIDCELEIMVWTGLDVIKAIRTSVPFDERWLDSEYDASILIDSGSPGLFGGTGEKADWTKAKEIASENPHVYLAGGLDCYNVADAIRIVRPYAVDVASGVESSPGKKDPSKVAAFIDAVRKASLS